MTASVGLVVFLKWVCDENGSLDEGIGLSVYRPIPQSDPLKIFFFFLTVSLFSIFLIYDRYSIVQAVNCLT